MKDRKPRHYGRFDNLPLCGAVGSAGNPCGEHGIADVTDAITVLYQLDQLACAVDHAPYGSLSSACRSLHPGYRTPNNAPPSRPEQEEGLGVRDQQRVDDVLGAYLMWANENVRSGDVLRSQVPRLRLMTPPTLVRENFGP